MRGAIVDPPRDPDTLEVPAGPGLVIADAVDELTDGPPIEIDGVDMNRTAAAFDVLFCDVPPSFGVQPVTFGGYDITIAIDDLEAGRAVLTEVARHIRADPGEDKAAAAEAITLLYRAREQLRRPAAADPEPAPSSAHQRLELVAMLVDLWRDGAADRLDGDTGLLMRMLRVHQVQDDELAAEREAIVALLGDPDAAAGPAVDG